MKKLLFFCLLSCLLCLILVSCGETKTTEANTTEPAITSQAPQTTEAPFSQVGTPITITPEEVEQYSQNENSVRHVKHHLLNVGDGSVIVVEYADDGESIIRAERFEDRTGKATVRDLAQIKEGMTVFDVVAIAGLPQGVTSGISGIIYVSDTQEERVSVQTDMAGNVVSVSTSTKEVYSGSFIDGGKLCLTNESHTKTYERYEADRGELTPKKLLCTFETETEIEGIVWDVYSAEEYPDLSYVVVRSHSGSWIYRVMDE